MARKARPVLREDRAGLRFLDQLCPSEIRLDSILADPIIFTEKEIDSIVINRYYIQKLKIPD
jgi:hypothetical protein